MKIKGMIKDSFMLTLGKSSRTILMMLYAMVASRLLLQSDYGTYKQMVLINTMMVTIIPFGIPISVSYYYQNLTPQKQSGLVSNTMATCFGLSLLCFAGMHMCKAWVVQLFNNPDLGRHYWVLCLYIFVTVFFHFLENLYISTGNAVLLGKVNVVFSICFFVGILVFTWVTQNLSYVFGWMLLSELVKSIAMCAILQKKRRYVFGIDFAFLKEQILYCIPLGLVAIAQFVNGYLDKLIISNRFSVEQYAVYVNGATEIPFISLITVSISTVALPTLSKLYNTDHDVDGMIEVWKDTQKTTAVLLYPVFWALMLCCHGVILFLYSDRYLDSVPYFVVFLFKMLLSITVHGNMLIILKKQKYTLYNLCITIVLSTVLNILLIRWIGMIGAAISSQICQCFVTYLQLVQIARFTGHKKRDLMPFGYMARLFFSGGAVTAVLFVVSRFLNFGHLVNMFAYGSLTLLLCFAFYYKLGLIRAEDVAPILKRFKRA